MSDLVRLSFSIESALMERFDELVRLSGTENRSEFIRDMIRERLVQDAWKKDEEVLGTLTLLFDHHVKGLTERLVAMQHEHDAQALASTHVHLDHHLCSEMILIRGRAGEVRDLAEKIRRLKGVLHAGLTLSSTGAGLGHEHDGHEEHGHGNHHRHAPHHGHAHAHGSEDDGDR